VDRPVVAFDIDGVLADFCYGFTTLHEGKGRSQGAQPTWDFAGHVDPTWEKVDASRYFWHELPCLASSAERSEMRALADRADILYITGRQEGDNDTFGQTRRWLHDWVFPHGNLILTTDKTPILAGFGSALVGVIEDRPTLISTMWKAGLPVYVRDWQYNREIDSRVEGRVSSLGEFVYLMNRRLDDARRSYH
jgi:hypothetical protein